MVGYDLSLIPPLKLYRRQLNPHIWFMAAILFGLFSDENRERDVVFDEARYEQFRQLVDKYLSFSGHNDVLKFELFSLHSQGTEQLTFPVESGPPRAAYSVRIMYSCRPKRAMRRV